MTKAQVLAEVIEVLAIERRSIFTAHRYWYAQRGKGFVHLWYHCPGTGGGDKFYFRPSRLLAHCDQQILSRMDGAPDVYSKAHWACVSCAMALGPVTHSPLDTGGSAGCARPPFCPVLETTHWYVRTPWSW